MVKDSGVGSIHGGRGAEENFLPLGIGLPHQLGDDAPHHRQTVRLLGIQDAARHGPPRLHVEDLGEALGIGAGHQDLPVPDLVEHVFALHQFFGQPGMGQRQKRVELRLVAVLLIGAPRHHDAAGAHIQAQRLGVFLIGPAHG